MRLKTYLKFCAAVLVSAIVFSSCASKKKASSSTDKAFVENMEMMKQGKELFTKVEKNAVNNDALSSKMKFTVETPGKDMSVSGQFEMKKDKYIRIRLTPMGLFEVAMIEFTTDYVLVLDRMHKEYIKASYAQLPFLQKNGIDFNALQSLFRNTIFVPGEVSLNNDSYKKFELKMKDGTIVASTKKGNLNYDWYLNKQTGLINKTEFTYISGNKTSKLNCNYSDFEDVAGKPFPHIISLSFISDLAKELGNMKLTVAAKKIKTEQKGDGKETSIPRRYKEKDVKGMLNKILEIK